MPRTRFPHEIKAPRKSYAGGGAAWAVIFAVLGLFGLVVVLIDFFGGK